MHSRHVDGLVIRPLPSGMDGRHHALVAYVPGDRRPAGIARLLRDGDTAVVAFEVADERHRRGIGTALAEALAADARAAGIVELRATVAGDNGRSPSLLRRMMRRRRATWEGLVAALE